MKALLLDFGSTFVKYSFWNTKKQENSEIKKLEFPKPILNEAERYEVKTEQIDTLFMCIIEEAVQASCNAVLICTQMHGYLLRRDGHFSHYISWKDKRGKAYLSKFAGVNFDRCGTALKENLPIVSLCDHPDLRGSELFTLGSYLIHCLTGKNLTHITDACASGFFDVRGEANQTTHPELQLPLAVCDIKPCGSYKGMAIYPAMGDYQISVLGSGITEKEALINMGTAAQLCKVVTESTAHVPGFEYRPYFLPDRRLMTLSGFSGKDATALADRLVQTMPQCKHALISSGDSNGSSSVAEILQANDISVHRCTQNVGNEGLKRIANSIAPRRGTMLSEVEFINFPLIAGKYNLDFFIIDNEHGNFENKTVTALAMNARYCGIDAIVRLPNNDRALITKLADGGVRGFLLPMTNTAADIAKAVEYAKYTPVGKRGISTARAHTAYGVKDFSAYMQLANAQMQIYAQIETRAGVEHLEEILDIPGVNGVFIGPNDLSCDLDCMGDDERIKPIIAKICTICAQHNKPCGIITTNKALIRHALLHGACMVSFGSEINMLTQGVKEISNDEYL